MGRVSFSVARNIRHNDLIHPSLILLHPICRVKYSTIHHFSTKLFAAQWSTVMLHTRHKDLKENEGPPFHSEIAIAALKQCRLLLTNNNYYYY